VPATEGAPGDAEPVGLSPASDAGCSSSGQGAAAPWAAALLALLVVARRGTRRRA
jgi:MYXO-CTERM domain-containing protein